MLAGRQRRSLGRTREQGFTLIVCVILMSLLLVVGVGLMTLAAIELRKSANETAVADARANARLALMHAIGQLQRSLGPDQRVSAAADILPAFPKNPHWTGVWRTTRPDGSPLLTRDDLNGGLRDSRWEEKSKPANEVLEWLVSGSVASATVSSADPVAMMRRNDLAVVEVPKIPVVRKNQIVSGNLAWWTGDLGVRANLGTVDPRADVQADRETPTDGGLFRVMISQASDMAMMTGGIDLDPSLTRRLASGEEIALTAAGPDWARTHALDFTVDSQGVLADVARGGLKRDLTAYFQQEGAVAALGKLDGLSDEEPLIGEFGTGSGAFRHQMAAPRFGLLKDWARFSVPYSAQLVNTRLPESDPAAGASSAQRALANEQPVKLAGNQRAGIQPILVEASNFTQMSTYLDRSGEQDTYQIRQLMYPRVVLWNPYNVEMKFARAIIMIQGNGRQEMWTKNENVNNLPSWGFREESQWINFEGGRSTNFSGWPFLMHSPGYNDPYMGSYYFTIPETTFEPGECLVFSPSQAAEYDGLSAYRQGAYDLSKNELSCEVAPDPSRCYFVSASEIGGGINFKPVEFWYAPTHSFPVRNQGDDTRAILKHLGDSGPVTFEVFDSLPQLTVLSASLQYGAGREPRIAWSNYERMPMELLDKENPQPTVVPNVRTREGIRLRWFDEHFSNVIGSGALSGSAHFDEAILANWNPRASFIVRSPWENIAGDPGGGPWFFGAYTRDLFDQAVSWDDQVPVPRGGRQHGNPFGPPQEGAARHVMFDMPRNETGLLSLAQFQHAKLSEFIWHPSYAVGNSLADPRLGTGGDKGLHRTSPVLADSQSAGLGGFHENEIGWSSDFQRSTNKTEWAANARSILAEVTVHDNLVYDLSFEANHALWDRYFLSSGSAADKEEFVQNPLENPLPNGRLVPAPASGVAATAAQLNDFHQSARHLMVDGAFNVNSTRVEAWKALLGSTRRSGYGRDGFAAFPRILNSPGGAWENGSTDIDGLWAGHRELSADEIDRLARAIVEQVKSRGPFLSLADFVNRRLAEDETGRMGALQAAIEAAGLNSGLVTALPLDNTKSLPDYSHPDNIADATRMEQTLKPDSKAWGATSYLTQADVLQVIGPALSARSDSFVIRAYGDSVDVSGKVLSRVWCEAVLQRTPEPLDPDGHGLNPRLTGSPGDFGRKFVITSFRWLAPGEI